jgi:hypothetical protein
MRGRSIRSPAPTSEESLTAVSCYNIGVARDHRSRRLLAVAGISATVFVSSIVIGTILGELPEALWVLLVPIGMLGAALVCIVSLGMLFAGRRPRDT